MLENELATTSSPEMLPLRINCVERKVKLVFVNLNHDIPKHLAVHKLEVTVENILYSYIFNLGQ